LPDELSLLVVTRDRGTRIPVWEVSSEREKRSSATGLTQERGRGSGVGSCVRVRGEMGLVMLLLVKALNWTF